MNCKPGDLAFVIAARATEYIGLPVTVLHHSEPLRNLPTAYKRFEGVPAWWVETERPVLGFLGNKRVSMTQFIMPDAALCPIRPDGITDKEVTELYLPKVTEVA